MKHLFLLTCLLFCFVKGNGKDVTITGLVKGTGSGKIYLSIHKGNELSLVDSAALDTKGNFKIILKDGYRQGVYKLQLDKYPPAALIIGKEEKISITAERDEIKTGMIHIVSSRDNDAYAVLSNFYKLYTKEIDSLQDILNDVGRFDPKYEAKTKDVKKAYSVSILRFNNSLRLVPSMFQGTFTAEVLCPLFLVAERNEFDFGKNYDTDEAFQHAHFFQNIDFADPRIVNTSTYEMKLYTYLDQYVVHTEEGFKKGVDNVMAGAKKNDAVRDFTVAYLLNIFTTKGPPNLVEYVHDNYSAGCELPMKSETEKLLNKLKQVSVGLPAPELVINDINYSPVSMKNTFKGKKLGLIYFWSSTCPHCMEHSPKVFKVYQDYKAKGLEVYSVSLDSDYGAWIKAVQDMKLEWINVSELNGWSSSAISTYALERTPTIFLVDKEGKILEKNFAPAELEAKVKKYLP